MFDVIKVVSNLGLKPTGAECGPDALLKLGLLSDRSPEVHEILGDDYSGARCSQTQILNPEGIKRLSGEIADQVIKCRNAGRTPIVLGGDCSVLIGCARAMAKDKNCGLFFMDGHQDFYLPSESPTGEVADMDLAIVTGFSSPEVRELFGKSNHFDPRRVVAFGARDEHEVRELGHNRIEATPISYLPFHVIENDPIGFAHEYASKSFAGLSGVWVHFDVDVLDDAIMPAVDYRLPGGLSEDAALGVLCALREHVNIAGLSVTIYNPSLDDPSLSAGKAVVRLMNEVLEKLATN